MIKVTAVKYLGHIHLTCDLFVQFLK